MVIPPGPAYAIGLLVDRKIVNPSLLEPDAHSNAGKPAPDNDDMLFGHGSPHSQQARFD
jgi:hypothetical protein